MTGAVVAAIALGGQSGGGSGGNDVTPNAISFANIAGAAFAITASQTIAGINTPITLEISFTGAPTVTVYVNGVAIPVSSGAQVTISNNQPLLIQVGNFTSSIISGTVTVTNVSDSSAVLATFNYSVSGLNFF